MFAGLAVAGAAGGCCAPVRNAPIGVARPLNLVFNPESTGYVEADPTRSNWPATEGYAVPLAELQFRESVYDYQGRFAFHGNDYIRQFQSVRQGRGGR